GAGVPRPDELPAVDDLREPGGRALQELRAPLEQWLRQHAVLDEEVGAEGVVDALAVSLGGLRALRPSAAPATRFTPEEVEVLTGRVLPALVADADDPEEVQQDLQAVWYQFLAFLGETGRWSGTAGHLETCLALLGPGEADPAELLAAAAEQVSAREEDAAVLTSFPVRVAGAVLARVGAGTAVPDDEEVSADDVAAVLAALGEHAPAVAAGEGGAAPRLEDVPWLRQVVLAMLDLELLDGEDDEFLAPGVEAATWLDDDEDARELRRDLVGRFLLDDPATLDGGFSAAEALLPTVLASSVLGEPLDETDLADLVEEAGDLGPAASAAVDEVRERLDELAAAGLVSREAPWTLERGFWPAVSAGISQQAEEGPGGLFGDGEEPLWFDSVADTLGLGDAQKQQIRDILGGR
ncbi:hypothetical protein, partial [Kineococcus indalonis]|uniref:hypothetical protein n=1 Tax=Kineococcus indalonis TaxID=2696566 RepID=UPI001412D415